MAVGTSTTRVSGPVRTCIGCREKAANTELLRVVAGSGADGRTAVVPDPDRTAPGRGAHLHPTAACFDSAVRRRAFARALRLSDGPTTALLAEHLGLNPEPSTGTGARSS